MKAAADIELDPMSDVTGYDQSAAAGADARYEKLDSGASDANHVTDTTGAARCNNGDAMMKLWAGPASAPSVPQRRPQLDSSSEYRIHQYEELPSPADSPRTPPLNGYLEAADHNRTAPTVTNPGASPTAAAGGGRLGRDFRHRENPLYEAPPAKSQYSNRVTSTGACLPCCLLVLVVVAVVLATAAVAMAAVALTMVLTVDSRSETNENVIENKNEMMKMLMKDMQYDFYSELNRTKERVDAMIYLLRDNVTQLRAQVDALHSLQSAQVTLRERLDQVETNLNVSQTRLWSDVRIELVAINSSLSDRIDVVSKMPGPPGPVGQQGPPGAGNMSACQHKKKTGGGHINTRETRSGPVNLTAPSPYQNWVMTGATCTTDTGTEALLKVYDLSVFECICGGNQNRTSTVNRYCDLHYWICPPTS